MSDISQEQHRARHQTIHPLLDELVADFMRHTGKLPSQASIMELIQWSYRQTLDPDEGPKLFEKEN